MSTGNRIGNVMALAAVVTVSLAVFANAAVVHSFNLSTDGSPVVTGDVPVLNNPNGLQITGEANDWAVLSPGSPASATDDGVTLSFDVSGSGGSGALGGTVGDARGNNVGTDALRTHGGITSADVPWTLTGLTANGFYDMIWYNKRESPGELRAPNIGITGFDAGNGIGVSGPHDLDRDQNFLGVQADATGTISGTWFITGGLDGVVAVAGVQVIQVVPAPAALPAGLALFGLAAARRRRLT